jgi:hypothetical protein
MYKHKGLTSNAFYPSRSIQTMAWSTVALQEEWHAQIDHQPAQPFRPLGDIFQTCVDNNKRFVYDNIIGSLQWHNFTDVPHLQ